MIYIKKFVVLWLVMGSVSWAEKPINFTLNYPATPSLTDMKSTQGLVARRHVKYDPFEPVNRVFFDINYGLDKYFLRPVSLTYKHTVPGGLKKFVSSFLTHLSSPLTLLNNLLQGDISGAAHTFARFCTNTIVGGCGLVDTASLFHLDDKKQTFTDTFVTWGMGMGSYSVWPLLGPSSTRGTVGWVCDSVFDPTSMALRAIGESNKQYVRLGGEIVDQRTALLGTIKPIYDNSLDPYVTVRTAYLPQIARTAKDKARLKNVLDGDDQWEEDEEDDEA
jgi:phospholipid-binding lipoprotein MlaA